MGVRDADSSDWNRHLALHRYRGLDQIAPTHRRGTVRFVLAEQRDLLRHVFHAFDGHEVDTQGDAFFVAFARATDAVSAAVAVQRALFSHAWPEGVTLRVRVGLHTGEPVRAAEGYVGLDVHHAARIMSAGHGGQVLALADDT